MSDRGAIAWDEWELEARRLHAIQPPSGSCQLSAAQQVLARLLGRAHWHEVEEAQKQREQSPMVSGEKKPG